MFVYLQNWIINMDFFKFVHINKSPQRPKAKNLKPISKEHTLKPNAGIVLTYPFFFSGSTHTHRLNFRGTS